MGHLPVDRDWGAHGGHPVQARVTEIEPTSNTNHMHHIHIDRVVPPALWSSGRLARRATQAVGLAICTAAAAAPDLTTMSLEQLMQVSVVGASKYQQRQSDVAAAVSILTRQEIKAFGWRSLADALASLPGVHTTYDRQYTYLGARGFGLPGDLTTRLLITINGNRVNDPTFDQGPAGREFPLDMDLVERIEFIPGPGGAVYGQNAMLGVVNVVTRSGADLAGSELALSGQLPQRLGDGRASWGARLDNGVDVLLSAAAMRARGADRPFTFGSAAVAGVAARLDGERLTQFFARVARGPWSFDYVRGDRRKDDPAAAYGSDPLAPGQYKRDGYDLANLEYNGHFAADTLQVAARLFSGRYRYNTDAFYSGELTQSPAAGDWRGGELRLLWTAVAGHKLMLGLEAQRNGRTDQLVVHPARPADDLRIAGSGHRLGLYAQDEWQMAPTLSATLGLRADQNRTASSGASAGASARTSARTSPRAALIWQATPVTTLKLLVGRAHRLPNAYERDFADSVSQVANPGLTGERIDTVEAVADHRIGPDLGLRAALYRWTMRDIIALSNDPLSGLTQYQSGGAIKASGLELSIDKTWSHGARLRSSLSLQDAAQAAGGRLLNSPQLLAKLNLATPLPWAGWQLGYELRHDSARLSLDGTRLRAYAVSNLNLSTQALIPGAELSVNISNLFDTRYAQPAASFNWQNALAQDGRSVRLTMTVRR